MVLSARTKDNKSFLIARKITSSQFPVGGYLLIHYPFAKHLFSSRSNEITESNSNTFDLIMSNEISNQIISNNNDVSNEIDSRNSKENGNLKNRYSMKFKRNASKNLDTIIENCCPGAPNDNCGKYFCSH